MSRVFIGVGHGGRDPGAIANGLCEADVNLVVGLAVRDELSRYGVEVKLSRLTDEDDPLSSEIAEANAFAPDLAIDVHNNAGGGDGFEAYVQTNKHGTQSRRLAQLIETKVKALEQNSRGIKTKLNSSGVDYFGWLRSVNAPAVLLEGAFLDTTDCRIVDELHEQQDFGIAYAKGILEYLGIDSKTVPDNAELEQLQAENANLRRQFDELERRIKWLDEDNRQIATQRNVAVHDLAQLKADITNLIFGT